MKLFLRNPDAIRWLLLLALPPMVLGAVVLATWVQPMALDVAFSPDGILLATTSEQQEANDHSGQVTVWDLKAARRHLLIRPATASHALAFSPDGYLLATGQLDGSIAMWDVMTGALIQSVHGGRGPILFLAWAPRGSGLLFSVSYDKALLHDLAAPSRDPAALHVDEFRCAAMSRNGKRVAIATGSRGAEQICLYDISDGEFALLDSLPIAAVGLALSDNGNELAASDGRGIAIWDIAGQTCVAMLPDPSAGALDCFSRENLLVSAGHDASYSHGTVQVWDASTRRSRQLFRGSHDTSYWSVAFSPEGRQVAATSSDGSTTVWNAVDGRCLAVVNESQPFFWSIAALVAVFAVWSIAWVRSGRSLKGRLWPFIDVFLLSGLVLAGLLLRQCLAWQAKDVGRLPAALAMGVVASMPALLFFWGAFGKSRWQARLPGVTAGLAVVWCVPLAVWQPDEAWQHLVCATGFLASLGLAFEAVRSRGVRLVQGNADSDGDAGPQRKQFRITDLF
ncbi:MAG: WD40 repeat domain-containing protein, partial [Pirellulales bacterium]